MAELLVLETSAFLDLLVGNEEGRAVREALRRHLVHVSDHEGVAVAIALKAMTKRGLLSQAQLTQRVRLLATAPFIGHPALSLLLAATTKSGLRLGDALCVELSDRLGAPLVTTDPRLATVWPGCWLIAAPSAGPQAAPTLT